VKALIVESTDLNDLRGGQLATAHRDRPAAKMNRHRESRVVLVRPLSECGPLAFGGGLRLTLAEEERD
jgi:hypothetical protein